MADARLKVLPVLRKLGGKATVGEVVEGTGLPAPEATETLWKLVNELEGDVEVGKGGDVLFKFPPGLKKPTKSELWANFWGGLYRGFKQLFKVGIMLMLVVYFVVFALLALCMAVAALARVFGDSDSSDSDTRWTSSGHSSSGFDFGDLFGWLWWTEATRPQQYQPYDRWQRGRGMSARKAPAKPQLPMFERVVAYVFGDETPPPDPTLADREALAYIREHAGVLTATDLVALRACTMKEAGTAASQLAFRNGGFVEVTDSGQLLFRFEDIMSRVGNRQGGGWSYAWERPEPARVLNSNGAMFNGVVTCMNGFNLLFAGFLVTPGGLETLSDSLGSDFSGAGLVLGGIPFLFSLLFFGIPVLRWFANGVANEQIQARNRWKELVQRLMQKHVQVERAAPLTPQGLGGTAAELRKLGDEYGAHEEGNGLVFDRLRDEWTAVSAARRGDEPVKWRFGGVVFDTETAPNVRPGVTA